MDRNKVFPDEQIDVNFSSEFDEHKTSIILVVVYQYKCEDLDDIREKYLFAEWVPQSKEWSISPPKIGTLDRKLIDKKVVELQEHLKKEN